jgi:hypothetical protein
MSKPYNWQDDAIKCYNLAVKAMREQGVRRNEYPPKTPKELEQNMIGTVPVNKLDCVK